MNEQPTPQPIRKVNAIGTTIILNTVSVAGLVCLLVMYIRGDGVPHMSLPEAMIAWIVAQVIVIMALVFSL